MRIRVTLDEIAQGRKDSPDMCPVALAIARAVRVGFCCVRVYLDEIKLYQFNLVAKLQTPQPVAAWVERWDSGERVSPFEFSL